MSTAPPLNGQVIGMTHYATRALVQRVLDTVEMSFEQSVVLGLVAASDAPIDRDDVVSRTTSGLKVSERAVLETVAQLEANGLVSAGSAITVTDAGRKRHRFIRATRRIHHRRAVRRSSGWRSCRRRTRPHNGDGASEFDARQLTVATVAAWAALDSTSTSWSTTSAASSTSSPRRTMSTRSTKSAHVLAELIRMRLGTDPELVVGGAGPHVHWRGGERARVLVLGHHDTVFPLGTLAARPFTVRDGRATGPGVFDMKAGIVTAIHAVESLADRSGVELLVTCDEEVGSLTSRQLIEERAAACGRVLVLEPAGRRRGVEGRAQGCRHVQRRHHRACCTCRAGAGERRQRHRRGGPSGAGDHGDRPT